MNLSRIIAKIQATLNKKIVAFENVIVADKLQSLEVGFCLNRTKEKITNFYIALKGCHPKTMDLVHRK